jgi:hypothetical protein
MHFELSTQPYLNLMQVESLNVKNFYKCVSVFKLNFILG